MTRRKFTVVRPTAEMKSAVQEHLDSRHVPLEETEWVTIGTVQVKSMPVYFAVGGQLMWAFEYQLNGKTFLFQPDSEQFLEELNDGN